MEDIDLKDKITLLETYSNSLGWTDMALDREQGWVAVNTTVILRVAWKAEDFFKS